MITLIRWLVIFCAIVLVMIVLTTSALLQKSTLTWPVAAPTQVARAAPEYFATGWTVSSPFGWRSKGDRYELHEGIDLAGPMFCHGCAVAPLGDVEVAQVDWDQPWGDDPLRSGAGVIVDMTLQHPEEAGSVRIRYGHLQPYRVHVRTRSCTRTIDCPNYQHDGAGSVIITCPGQLVETSRSSGEASYAYATPGRCTAEVAWPDGYIPQGDTKMGFDQQIVPGAASSDAAITFNAELPPPPTPVITPTVELNFPTRSLP